jgi:diaminohydroxyphosphoribosylaminopyrimidine deaminase/5-amino-6-(5-phosphoribosylamino)uracil reductase
MDQYYMARAIELAQRGRFTTSPNPNVGCIIVKEDMIVGEGFHYRAGMPHAEINALVMAGPRAHNATAYITLEPCTHDGRTPPCCDSLIQAGISRVVIAMRDPNPSIDGSGISRLRREGIQVECGLMRKQSALLNRGFIKRMCTGLPFVQLKVGISLDGRIAMANGESKWITSIDARHDVQNLRAQSSAILSSSSTVLTDNPLLTVRWEELNEQIQDTIDYDNLRQPIRVIVDGSNRITPDHQICNQLGETWLMRHHLDEKPLWQENVKQLLVPKSGQYLDLKAILYELGKQEINLLWVEAGGNLSGALLQHHMVDELIVYISPKLLGSTALAFCHLEGLSNLADALRFSFSNVQNVGPDLRLTLQPNYS